MSFCAVILTVYMWVFRGQADLEGERAVYAVGDGGGDATLGHSVVAGVGEALAVAAALRRV